MASSTQETLRRFPLPPVVWVRDAWRLCGRPGDEPLGEGGQRRSGTALNHQHPPTCSATSEPTGCSNRLVRGAGALLRAQSTTSRRRRWSLQRGRQRGGSAAHAEGIISRGSQQPQRAAGHAADRQPRAADRSPAKSRAGAARLGVPGGGSHLRCCNCPSWGHAGCANRPGRTWQAPPRAC